MKRVSNLLMLIILIVGCKALKEGFDSFFDSCFGSECNPELEREKSGKGEWKTISSFEIFSVVGHTAIWTGSEMIIWGGYDKNRLPLKSGWRYNPSTDTWSPISNVDAPQIREPYNAIWGKKNLIHLFGQVPR